MIIKLCNYYDNLYATFVAMPMGILVVLKVLLILFFTGTAVKIGKHIIKNIFNNQKKFIGNMMNYHFNEKRTETLKTITSSVYSYLIYIFAFLSVLTYVADALNLASLLTFAGIGGILIGWSAQNSIKDMLSGLYILFDDQYWVGEQITIDNLTGKVEELELRVTKIRADNGDLYIFANGDIRKVINHSRGIKAVEVEIPVAYTSDYARVLELANEVCQMVNIEFDFIVEPAKVLGITAIAKDGSYNIKIIAKTPPLKNFDVEIRIRQLIVKKFNTEKIGFIEKNNFII